MSFLKNIFFALTKKERIIFLASSLVAVVSFVAVISIIIAEITVALPARGGQYSEGMVGQPEYVNPVIASGQADLSLTKLLYSSVSSLSDNITRSTDGKTWTVHLKDNLTWQDGQKLTSDDVIFTVASIQDPDAKSPLADSWRGVTVNRVSELELTFSVTNPYAFFQDNLDNLYIIPKHIFADTPPGNWRLSDYNLKPIGSGPYEFESYDERSDGFINAYHLTAWKAYPGNQPLIGSFSFRFFANTNDLLQSFNSGQVQGIGNISAANLSSIHRPYSLSAWRSSGYYAVFWNQSKNLALQDASVRQALSLAVDREALAASTFALPPTQNVANGVGGVADYGPVPPDAPDASTPATSSSLDLASTTLTQAGWIINASSSFRSKMIQKTMVPLVINLTVPSIDFLVATAQSLQNTWQSIGVQVTIATDTPENIVNVAIKNRSYESLLFGNVLGPSSDLYSFWDSSQRFSPGLNLAIYQNKNVDALIESERTNLSDASRTAEFAQAEQDIVTDNPAVFLYSPDYLFVTDKDLQGITPQTLPDPSDRFRSATDWYLGTTRSLK
jgi:peptide/nickel transport system substrate-binding protein